MTLKYVLSFFQANYAEAGVSFTFCKYLLASIGRYTLIKMGRQHHKQRA